MEDILKMDIFFIVATIGVVVVSVCAVCVLVALWKLLRTIDRIAEEVAEEAQAFRADLAEARTFIKREGLKAKTLISAFTKMGKSLLGRGSRRS